MLKKLLISAFVLLNLGTVVWMNRPQAADRAWPEIDPSLLVEETITLPVQVNGKKRGELTIAVDASQADVETATLALDAVRRALDGHPPRKIVVVPKRIVNVVV